MNKLNASLKKQLVANFKALSTYMWTSSLYVGTPRTPLESFSMDALKSVFTDNETQVYVQPEHDVSFGAWDSGISWNVMAFSGRYCSGPILFIYDIDLVLSCEGEFFGRVVSEVSTVVNTKVCYSNPTWRRYTSNGVRALIGSAATRVYDR